MLKKYLKVHNTSKRQFCIKAGISRPTLNAILNKNAKDITYRVAIKIKKETGLYPWDYSDNFEDVKKLYEKR